MARQIQVSAEDIQRAKQLRDQATTVAEYRKALCVILSAELSIDAYQTAELLGTSRRTVFRDRDRLCSQCDTTKKAATILEIPRLPGLIVRRASIAQDGTCQ